MKIKSLSSTKQTEGLSKNKTRGGKFDVFCRWVVLLNVVALAVLGYLSHQHRWVIVEAADKLNLSFGIYDVKYLGAFIAQRIQGFFVEPEVLFVDIKHIDVQKLAYQRDAALNGAKDFSYVPALLSHNGEKFKTKLRLKGDRDIHFDDLDSASYRVKIKNGKTLWGMNFFSLQKPRARNYIHEWIFLRMTRREGIITPRYRFAKLVVNGKENGVYAVEEHYTKFLLENNRSKEGPILRFAESPGANYATATITPYNQKKWLTGEQFPITEKAIQLLEGYRRRELAFSEVFDTKKWASFFAVGDLTSSRHALVANSLRIYYNPITSRLEPIPFDGHFGAGYKETPLIAAELGITEQKNWAYEDNHGWFYGLFNDPKTSERVFIEAYVAALEKLSNPEYLAEFFARNHEALNHNLAVMNSETNWHDNVWSFGPIPYVYKESKYYETAQHIRSLLVPILDAFVFDISADEMVLEIINRHRALPAVILGAGCTQIVFRAGAENFIHARKSATAEADSVRLSLRRVNRGDSANECLNLYLKMPGLDTIHSVPLRAWRPANSLALKRDFLRKPSNYRSYSFFEVREGNKLVMTEGKHTLNETVIIDNVDVFEIEAGTDLTLTNKASLIVKAPVKINGTLESPVVVRGDDGGGFAVISASDESTIDNAVFDKLSNPQEPGWSLSGSVTFYEAAVTVRNTQFLNNVSEDAFNGVRAKINITNSHFENVLRDAIDVDFGNINARDLSFEDIGNDAIDISGTTATVESITIQRVGDKAISVGEKSSFYGRSIHVNHAKIGVASKDSSTATFDELLIEETGIGYAVFQKKSEYGPGHIESRNAQHNRVKQLAVVEIGSSLVVNEITHPGNLTDIRERLYDE